MHNGEQFSPHGKHSMTRHGLTNVPLYNIHVLQVETQWPQKERVLMRKYALTLLKCWKTLCYYVCLWNWSLAIMDLNWSNKRDWPLIFFLSAKFPMEKLDAWLHTVYVHACFSTHVRSQLGEFSHILGYSHLSWANILVWLLNSCYYMV